MQRIEILKSFAIIPILSMMLINTSVFADDGDRKIRISGQLAGDISQKRISIKELEQPFELQQTQIYNPWEKKTATYKGIWLNEVAAKLALQNVNEITFKAIDDYEVTIKKEEWQKFRILLVTQEDGQYLSISNKGPLRIVYPDYTPDKKEYELNLYKWMWMINKIEFR